MNIIMPYQERLPETTSEPTVHVVAVAAYWVDLSPAIGTPEYALYPIKDKTMSKKSKKTSKKAQQTKQYKDTNMNLFKGKQKTKGYTPCWEGHPTLPLSIDGKDYELIGGSATQSVPAKDVDVFIGFDYGMKQTGRRFPWNEGIEFLFEIKDMSVPDNVGEFNQLLNYVKDQIVDGKKVFVGCIGGHGRTGLFMAAFVAKFCGIEDAITYVRENYCDSAVESISQVNWLHTHFNVKKVSGTKDFGSGHGYGSYGYDPSAYGDWGDGKTKVVPPNNQVTVPPLHNWSSVHGQNWQGK